MCYHVCEQDTKLPGKAFHLRLIMLKMKMTALKTVRGVTEIFETKESAKPNKIHAFITGGKKEEQEM